MITPTFIQSSLLVALGGGAGAWLRFAAGRLVGASAFPWATLSVNVIGSFAMGLLTGWLARNASFGEGWRLLLGVGVLGGFTTFSAFSLEMAQLIQREALAQAGLYAAASLVAGVLGLFAGLAMMRSFS
jgi:fluoride exporter